MYAVVTMKVGIRLPKGAKLTEAADGTGIGIKIKGKEYKPLLSLECEDETFDTDSEYESIGMEVVDYIESDVKFVNNKEYPGATPEVAPESAPEIAVICHGGLVQGVRANFKAKVGVYDIDDMEETMDRELAYQTMEKDTKHLKSHIY